MPRDREPCFVGIWRDCKTSSGYFAFSDGSMYHYPGGAAEARNCANLLLRGKTFNLPANRRPLRGFRSYEKIDAIPDTAVELFPGEETPFPPGIEPCDPTCFTKWEEFTTGTLRVDGESGEFIRNTVHAGDPMPFAFSSVCGNGNTLTVQIARTIHTGDHRQKLIVDVFGLVGGEATDFICSVQQNDVRVAELEFSSGGDTHGELIFDFAGECGDESDVELRLDLLIDTVDETASVSGLGQILNVGGR